MKNFSDLYFKNKKGQKALIVSLAAGESHILALDTLGNVYSWGDNKKGQLGLGEYIKPEGHRTRPKDAGQQPVEEEKLQERDSEFTPEQVIDTLKDHEVC